MRLDAGWRGRNLAAGECRRAYGVAVVPAQFSQHRNLLARPPRAELKDSCHWNQLKVRPSLQEFPERLELLLSFHPLDPLRKVRSCRESIPERIEHPDLQSNFHGL